MADEIVESDALNPPPPPLYYAPPQAWESRWGKGFLAVCGTALFWGVGHAIAGRGRRGVGWLLAWLGAAAAFLTAMYMPSLVPALLVLVPIQALLGLAIIVDSFLCGRSSTRPMLRRPIWRYLAGFGLLAVAMLLGRIAAKPTAQASDLVGVHGYRISTHAMLPTLRPGDHILVHRAPTLRRWDLAVFHPPGRPDLFTQRIAGLPGEKVEIIGGQLHVNDQIVASPPGIGPYALPTPYGPQTGCAGHPIRLGPDEYFLLGDNSSLSYDCRLFADSVPGHQVGAIPRESIMGRVTAIYWPIGRLYEFR